MKMTNHIVELEEALLMLESTYEVLKEELSKEFPGIDHRMIKDTTGRHIMLDLLVEIVHTKTALAQAKAVFGDPNPPTH